VRTEEGKLYLFVAIDRASKFAFARLHERAMEHFGSRREPGSPRRRFALPEKAE